MSNLTIRAEHIELRQLRPWLDDQAGDLGESLIGRVELCVIELAANVIDHSGASQISLHLDSQPSRLSIELNDLGEPMAEETELAPHPRVRGYGMMIAEQLASELSYERHGDTNVWRASFDIDA